MSGSGASILGYGNIIPNSNINATLVNVDSSSYASGLSSNEIPQSTLFAAKNNVDAANAFIPSFKGGKKSLKRKIKNIVKMYKMSKKSKKTLKHKISKMIKKSKTKAKGKVNRTLAKRRNERRRRTRRRTQKHGALFRGGYSQYQNNQPLTPSYSLGGNLEPSLSGLANPPPVTVLSGCANCTDNYNHFLGTSFQSRGWGAK
jgi:hypothetical protein